ncbi:MAG: low molecular weight phosphatase family protein [Pseudomonadota bacterium]
MACPPLDPALEKVAPRSPRSVLFVCNENAVRSPMAEGLAKHYFRRRIFADSVGLRTGTLDPFSVAVMAELGIDIARHRPKTFAELKDPRFDLVISLTPEAQHHAVELARGAPLAVEYWPTFDPTLVEGSRGVRMQSYREVRDALRKRIISRFDFAKAPPKSG